MCSPQLFTEHLLSCDAESCSDSREYRDEASASGTLESLRLTGNRASQEAVDIRDKFKTYFNSNSGQVPWQRNACFGNAP